MLLGYNSFSKRLHVMLFQAENPRHLHLSRVGTFLSLNVTASQSCSLTTQSKGAPLPTL